MSRSPQEPSRRQALPVVNPADKVAQLRRLPPSDSPSPASQVHRPDPAENLPPEKRRIMEKVVDAIRQVHDPEIPINIYELGLVYGIDIADDNSVRVRMTLTAPGCPVAGSLVDEVERRIENIPEVPRATVELVWDPPWQREMMSEAARLQLGL